MDLTAALKSINQTLTNENKLHIMTSDFGLRTSDFGLRTSDKANCCLKSEDSQLHQSLRHNHNNSHTGEPSLTRAFVKRGDSRGRLLHFGIIQHSFNVCCLFNIIIREVS